MDIILKEKIPFWRIYFFLLTNQPRTFVTIINTIFPIHFIFIVLYGLSKDDYIGAFDGNKLIALLCYNRKYKRITFTYVNKKYRNKGIGKMLIERSGCIAVRSYKKAKTYWIKQGFNIEVANKFLIKVD